MSKGTRWIFVLAIAAIVLGGAAVYAAFPRDTGQPAASGTSPVATSTSPSPGASPDKSADPVVPTDMSDLAVGPHQVNLKIDGWYSWAIMDLRTGELYGSKNMHETQRTASMIKAWIASDYLRRQSEAGQTPTAYWLGQVAAAIQKSDNTAASNVWGQVGRGASTKRMISMCNLKDSVSDDNWSNTRLSAYDTAKLAACIDKGTAAGTKWTPWLLTKMRTIILGDFGIRKAFPADVAKTIAIKNGWVTRTSQVPNVYTVNCLAIGDNWTMGVLTNSPLATHPNETYGASVCKQVAAALRN
jgi:hypothetical protein